MAPKWTGVSAIPRLTLHCSTTDMRNGKEWGSKSMKSQHQAHHPAGTEWAFQRFVGIAERQRLILQRRRCGSQSGNGRNTSQKEEKQTRNKVVIYQIYWLSDGDVKDLGTICQLSDSPYSELFFATIFLIGVIGLFGNGTFKNPYFY